MKEPQAVHSHRGPESAGARWILRCVAPQKEEGGLPLHPSSPGRGCDRASPGAGGEGTGSPGSLCLRPKGLAPQALAPTPRWELDRFGVRRQGARANWSLKSQRNYAKRSVPPWLFHATTFLGTSPCLALPQSMPQCLCLVLTWGCERAQRAARAEARALGCHAGQAGSCPRPPLSLQVPRHWDQPGSEEPAAQMTGQGHF